MSSDTPTKKSLALSIIDFLNTSAKDGTIDAEEAESIEVATSCIAAAFDVDPSAPKDTNAKSLLEIYTVYEKLMKGKSGPSPSKPTESASSQPDAKTKAEAEAFKSQGNAAIQKKDYKTAIDMYTKALDLVPLNPIYLSNRAAAYSGSGKHTEAVSDAEMAVAADPKFAKAWSRLGFAKYALGDAKGAMEAYKQGIDAEGNGGSEAMRKGYETAKKKVEEEGDLDDEDDVVGARGAPGAGAGGMPDLASLAGMFGGGGAGGQGGMPDFASMMQNPMMQQMASNLMRDPNAMQNLLNNPRLKDMFGGAGGGGMPDIGSLMQDPSIMEMAKNLMGGAPPGGPGGPGAGRGGGSGSSSV